ncbi:hypothetical protein DAPPUDRAFT_307450 [Daphnia pulex]|uniref:Uncharacterized protein n=1 Tax=Daphnia pulex TaxID=6669 RepID=E9H2B8_DAPPU|nr:hypothetical protein DAPPUDRAFT_307450 [Daphnia pulex]|eukprot:EFX74146.1 hypothetical protein DAPPUDRAFT_307450 [Daphnia pulex]
MFQKVFLFACILAVMAIVHTNSESTDDVGGVDETFCKPYSTCTTVGSPTECKTNLLYKNCRTNLIGIKQCCL